MSSPLWEHGENRAPTGPSHLSYSRINRYLLCPEQYRLYYVENLRPRYPSASLTFGRIVHQALAQLFQTGEDPTEVFTEMWSDVRQQELTYAQRDSWEKFRDAGRSLLEKFVQEELPRIEAVEASEKGFRLDISSLDLPFVGIIDLVADVEGKRTVVDFKTSGSAYPEHEARMADQLTAYQLAEPEAEQAALCVLIRTKNPRIEWQFTARTAEELTSYLAKAELVAHEIAAGHFYKRPGRWCSWCEFLPVCLRDEQKIEETLVQLS